MRYLVSFVVSIALVGVVHADPRSDMAAALAARADTNPAPAVLPTSISAPARTAVAPISRSTRQIAEQVAQNHANNGQAIGLMRKAQEAAMAAAGQAQEKKAKDRASKTHTK
jgi:hypothetical protein